MKKLICLIPILLWGIGCDILGGSEPDYPEPQKNLVAMMVEHDWYRRDWDGPDEVFRRFRFDLGAGTLAFDGSDRCWGDILEEEEYEFEVLGDSSFIADQFEFQITEYREGRLRVDAPIVSEYYGEEYFFFLRYSCDMF